MNVDVSKIKKSVRGNIAFISDVLPEKAITFVKMWLFLKKNLFFSKARLFAHAQLCGNIPYLLYTFTRERDCLGFISWYKTSLKMFPTILCIKNVNRAQKNFFQNMNVEDISYLWNIFGVVSPKFYPESQKSRVPICLSVHFILRDFKIWAVYR